MKGYPKDQHRAEVQTYRLVPDCKTDALQYYRAEFRTIGTVEGTYDSCWTLAKAMTRHPVLRWIAGGPIVRES